MKRFLAGTLVCCMVMILFLLVPQSASAEDHRNVQVNRFNVVLVVDKSGSLHNETSANGRGTDDGDLRFDAIKLFLALLTESGNNVGAVAFDSDVKPEYIIPIKEMNNQGDKDMLVNRIQAMKVGGDTNIGLGLSTAKDMLLEMQKQNGLPCVLLLLTDGNTDFSRGTVSSVSGAIKEAVALGTEATDIARANNIKVYGIMLGDGKKVDGKALDEMESYTRDYDSVTSADELPRAFRKFYSIINSTEYTGVDKKTLENGYAETDFYVPSFGLEEVNIVIEHPANGKSLLKDNIDVTVFQPDGAAYSTSAHRVDTSHYIIVKIPQPTSGRWRVELRGQSGDTVDVSKIFNSSLTLGLTCSDDPSELIVNRPYSFTLSVEDAYIPRLTMDDLRSMKAMLHLRDKTSNRETTVEMTPVEGGYRYEACFEEEARYDVFVSLSTDGGFEVKSNSIETNVIVPSPETTADILRETVSFGFFKSATSDPISFEELFFDPKGTQLHYAVSDDLGGRVKLDGNGLVVSRSGMKVNAEEVTSTLKGMKLGKEILRFELIATDSYAYGSKSCTLPVEITVTDSRLLVVILVILAVLAVIAAFVFWRLVKSSQRCHLQIAVVTSNGDRLSLYNFKGKRTLRRAGLGTPDGKLYYFAATKDPNVCVFKGSKPFMVKNQAKPTKCERISSGLPKVITLSSGLELNISAMTMRF